MMNHHLAPDEKYIFVKWITRKGKRVYATQYGYSAFRIKVKV